LAFSTASQITNRLVSLMAAYVFTTYQLSDEEHPRWAYFGHQAWLITRYKRDKSFFCRIRRS
jgi:hypothetical protein